MRESELFDLSHNARQVLCRLLATRSQTPRCVYNSATKSNYGPGCWFGVSHWRFINVVDVQVIGIAPLRWPVVVRQIGGGHWVELRIEGMLGAQHVRQRVADLCHMESTDVITTFLSNMALARVSTVLIGHYRCIFPSILGRNKTPLPRNQKNLAIWCNFLRMLLDQLFLAHSFLNQRLGSIEWRQVDTSSSLQLHWSSTRRNCSSDRKKYRTLINLHGRTSHRSDASI